jgi:YVTN family beta-propeller protein
VRVMGNSMRVIRWLSLVCFVSASFAQQAPWGRADIPVSGHDRVYAADQTSNTVSVIDPSSNKLLGVIRLGDPVPGALSPLYKGELLVHGLGYSPDSKTLAVVSVASNSVTLIDTGTNSIRAKIYVGRSPTRRSSPPTDANCGSRCGAKTMSRSSIQSK